MSTHSTREGHAWVEAGQEFYPEFTLRNSDFISQHDQDSLRSATILVAGCGSTGGSTIEILVRTGAEHLILADNGTYELNNINRQNMTLADVGRPKPEVFVERCRNINPGATLETYNEGITADNVESLVVRADVVIDAVDVTTRAGLRMKWRLHEEAKRHGKPVIAGYDMGTAQYVPIYDYRRADVELLHGAITAEHIERLEPLGVCTLLVPDKCLRNEIVDELHRVYTGKGFVSQLAIAANLFGVIATATVIEMLAGRAVRSDIYQDVRDWIQVGQSDRALIAREQILTEVNPRRILPDAAPPAVATRLATYRPPQLYDLLSDPILAPYACRRGIAVYKLRHADIQPQLADRLTEFAFVNYARVGFIDLSQVGDHLREPRTNFHADDRHVVVIDTTTGSLLAYATFKAAVDHAVPFSDENRNWLATERAFGRDVCDSIDWIQTLPIESIREVGRVTRCQSLSKDDPRATRATAELVAACFRHMLDPDNRISAIVGDGEPDIMIATLRSLGARPVLIDQHRPNPPQGYLVAPRYEGRDVNALAFRTDEIDRQQLDSVEAALALPDAEWMEARRVLRNQVH